LCRNPGAHRIRRTCAHPLRSTPRTAERATLSAHDGRARRRRHGHRCRREMRSPGKKMARVAEPPLASLRIKTARATRLIEVAGGAGTRRNHTMKMGKALATAAVSGVLMGTLVGCGGGDK